MDAYDITLARRSVRKYQPTAVARELLTKVVDAARLAPTARNEQPWDFVIVTDAAKRRQLAQLASHNGPFIADAPACIVVLCRPTPYYLEDGSAATTQMMIAARALGLGTCWIAGDKKPYAEPIVDAVGAPPTHKLVSLVAIGYAADIPAPPKRPLDDVLHWEQF
jgi:nitroreductase